MGIYGREAYLLKRCGTSLSVGSWSLLVCFLVDALFDHP